MQRRNHMEYGLKNANYINYNLRLPESFTEYIIIQKIMPIFFQINQYFIN